MDGVLLLYMPVFFWVCLDIEQWKGGLCLDAILVKTMSTEK